MTERERLIDMLAHIGNMRIMRHGLGECADYMLANGVIVPPCKVGDMAYYLTTVDTLTELGVAEIFAGNVFSVINDLTGIWIFCRYDNGLTYYHKESDIGKTVFLTREEAEKALAERSNDGKS